MIAALGMLGALVVACSSASDSVISNTEVIFEIPWDGPETARYHIVDRSDVEGLGILTLEEKGGTLVLSQVFDIPEEDVTDFVIVEADPVTLRPWTVSRVIDGPDGQRLCDAIYAVSSVRVDQVGEDGNRTDVIDVPDRSYDTWGDLFLWRTLNFRVGFEVSYRDVLSCSLSQPELLTVGLTVKEIETVAVPAGTFDAWRLEIRSGGGTQEAWFSIDDGNVLVKYDNGLQVWELESFEPGVP